MDCALHQLGSWLWKEGACRRCPRLCHGAADEPQEPVPRQAVCTPFVALLTISLFSVVSRGGAEAAQRAPPQRLHGAELPEPEPRPQPAHQPGPGGTGAEERGSRRRSAGALAGLPGRRDVDGHGHLRHRSQRLPRPAELQPDGLELLQPRPQVRTGGCQTRRPAQVAPSTRGPQQISKGEQPEGQWRLDPGPPPPGVPFVTGSPSNRMMEKEGSEVRQFLPPTCIGHAGSWG